jgi:hypothetical protein
MRTSMHSLGQGAVLSLRKRRIGRIFFGFLTIALLISRAPIVYAGTSYYYSPLCLGDWTGIKHVEGAPETDSNPSDFTDQNSATIQNTTGQIFCGRFTTENAPSGDIRSVTLRIAAATSDMLPNVPAADFFNGATLDGFDQGAVFVIPEETETPSALPSLDASIAEPTIAPDTEVIDVAPMLPEELTPLSTHEPESIPSLQNVIIEEASPLSIPEESGEQSSLLRWLVPEVHAEEQQLDSLDALLSVRYSSDGEHWSEVGILTRDNSLRARFDLPEEVFNNLDTLQISLVTGLGLDRSALYLDSMWIEVRYDSPVTDFLEEVAQTVVDIATPEEDQLAVTPQPTPLPKVKRTIWEFSLTDTEVSAQRDLPWYPTDTNMARADEAEVRIRTELGKIILDGSCREDYFVVLLFRNRNDYIDSPASALYNAAIPCESGSLTYTIDSLPVSLSNGSYWLLIAQQGQGPWEPISSLHPVYIKTRVIEE